MSNNRLTKKYITDRIPEVSCGI